MTVVPFKAPAKPSHAIKVPVDIYHPERDGTAGVPVKPLHPLAQMSSNGSAHVVSISRDGFLVIQVAKVSPILDAGGQGATTVSDLAFISLAELVSGALEAFARSRQSHLLHHDLASDECSKCGAPLMPF